MTQSRFALIMIAVLSLVACAPFSPGRPVNTLPINPPLANRGLRTGPAVHDHRHTQYPQEWISDRFVPRPHPLWTDHSRQGVLEPWLRLWQLTVSLYRHTFNHVLSDFTPSPPKLFGAPRGQSRLQSSLRLAWLAED